MAEREERDGVRCVRDGRGRAGVRLAAATVLAAALASGCAMHGAGGMHDGSHFGVKEIGSLHVGGRVATLSGLPERDIVFTAGAAPFRMNPNGEFAVEQMYVQFVRLHEHSRRADHKLFMMHGGGLTGVTWETKPDGRPGWQQYFLQAGHDVYVADAVERGRAGWARYPEIFKTEPVFRTRREGWALFRIGPDDGYDADPAKRRAFAETQFPIASYDQFTKQGVPRWATNDAATQAAYDAFVDQQCPCVIIVHSQGGNFAFNAALKHPGKVKAIVAVEPSGAPDPDKVDLGPLKDVPHLFVWGDRLDEHPLWKRIVPTLEKYRQGLLKAGATADRLALPEQGIRGNSHMLMMDRNSDAIAGQVNDWLKAKGLVR